MLAVAVSSQERKLRPRRRAAPSPQARGINLLSAPGPGRGDRFPARSRAARTSRPAPAGGKEGGEARESAPGSRRGSAGGTEHRGRRRVPAHPAAPAPPKAGAPRPLPQSWGRQKSSGNGGKKQEKGGMRARGPPQTRKPLGAVQPPPPVPGRSATETPGLLPLRSPQRAPTSSSDPTPQSPVRSADWGTLGCSFVSGVPATSQSHGRASGEDRHSVYLGHPEPREVSERAAGSLPRPASASQLVAGRSSRLGTVELITGGCVWLSSSWPSENAFAAAAERCSSGIFRELGSERACGRAGGRRSGRPGWERAGGRVGVCPGRAGRGGSRESSLGCARGGAPGGSSPGAAGPGPSVCREPWNEAGAQRPGRGAPSGRGLG